MKKAMLSLSLLAALSASADGPWKFRMRTDKSNIDMNIDLYEESINVPGMDMFGPMNGYISGNIYGIWTVTSSKIISDKQASMRLSNDLGSETQEVLLTLQGDSICKMELKGSVVIKRVEGKKLVKIDSTQEFKKK